MIRAKGLDGKAYVLESAFDNTPKPKHKPDQMIVAIPALGIGAKLPMEKTLEYPQLGIFQEYDTQRGRYAVVKSIKRKKGDTIIITASKPNAEKQEKKKLVNEIVRKIDFKGGLSDKMFIEMLTNVFSERMLKRLLQAKDIEVLVFKSKQDDGLMFLRCGGKAYRL